MKRHDVRALCMSAVTGAAYAALTMLLAPISYGAVQLRVSEALCVLPYFIPGTAWGLTLGCAIANILTGNIFDVIFGSLATLAAGLCTARIGRRRCGAAGALMACMMPVVFNGVVVGAVITRAYNGLGVFSHIGVFAINAAQVALGEAAVMLVLGLPLMRVLPRQAFMREFLDEDNFYNR